MQQICFVFLWSNLTLVLIMDSHCVLCRNSWLLKSWANLCDSTENLWVLTRNPMDFSQTKQADRDASEYYPDHCHTERGGSKTHLIHSPADSCQHPVLTILLGICFHLFAWRIKAAGGSRFCKQPARAKHAHGHTVSDSCSRQVCPFHMKQCFLRKRMLNSSPEEVYTVFIPF